MNAYVERAWELLKVHVGHEHPLKSADLAKMLGVGDEHRGTAETRSIILEVIRRGLPFGATAEGYFVLANQLEEERYISELQDRAQAILYRAKLVERAFANYHQGEAQKTLIHWTPEPEEEA